MLNLEQLFFNIQNPNDYRNTGHIGTDWKYLEDDNHTYILLKERKTLLNRLFDLLIIPIPYRFNKKLLWFSFEAYLKTEKTFRFISYDLKYSNLAPKNNKLYLAGWDNGGSSAIILSILLQKEYPNLSLHLITYGTPAVCFGKKTLQTVESCVTKWNEYLYHNDWIKYFIPLYSRKKSLMVIPKNEPQTLKERHRIYGKALYNPSTAQ